MNLLGRFVPLSEMRDGYLGNPPIVFCSTQSAYASCFFLFLPKSRFEDAAESTPVEYEARDTF